MQLTPQEVRVLGCLVEKQMTTPEYYPLTLNALVTACNQSSNRNPVVAYTPNEVSAALESLRSVHKLARVVYAGSGSRVDRFRHIVDERLGVSPAEKAVLGLLLLRGPQTVGELKARTERMHEFASLEDVERVLDRLADPTLAADPSEFELRGDSGMLASARRADAEPAAGDPTYRRPWDGPLVLRLPRQPGQKEARVAQLLGGPVDASFVSGATTVATGPGSRDRGMEDGRSVRDRVDQLEGEVVSLREQLETLRLEFDIFRSQFG